MTQAAFERLTEYLENLPSGAVDDEHRGKIENLLFACWGEFDNETVYEGMSGRQPNYATEPQKPFTSQPKTTIALANS